MVAHPAMITDGPFYFRRILFGMPNRTYLVKLRTNALQQVRAAKVEVHGEHLAFLTPQGKLAALFLLEIVESWNEIPS
jgi:hypothetical protein